ncbi:MAG: hypothetical protein EAZ27_00505 [Cytophagales bacterium]|nr:MAG: hypothetical protein EAZ27_00505 [Cytophagales bacterium]
MEKVIIETKNKSQMALILAYAKSLHLRTVLVDELEDKHLMALMNENNQGYATESEKLDFLNSLGK